MNSKLEFRPTRFFGLKLKLAGNLVFNLIPLSASVVALAGLGASVVANNLFYCVAGVAYAFLTISFSIFFLPTLNGSFLFPSRVPPRGSGFILQITFTPRRYRGLEGFLDDADDYGVFTLEGDYLVFRGESSTLEVHRADLAEVPDLKPAPRSLKMFQVVRFRLREPLNGVTGFHVHIKEGHTIVAARRREREFVKYLADGRLMAADLREKN